MIPIHIRVQQGSLPDTPGVYLMKDALDAVLYVGKATSLRRRVRQHFERPHNGLIEEMIGLVAKIDYIETPTVLEAVILEANLIKLHWPKYNTEQKDDRSFMYLAITDEAYPRPLLVRGAHLGVGKIIVGVPVPAGHKTPGSTRRGGVLYVSDGQEGAGLRYRYLFGPYTSARSLRVALELVRKSIPWSTCAPEQKRACFYTHLKQCPGVCVGAVSGPAYRQVIHDLKRFFEGKKETILKDYRRRMQRAANAKQFEEAAGWRNKVYALEHIQDVAVLSKEEDAPMPSTEQKMFGRIEGYDISHVSGRFTAASMVVFERGAPVKGEYRKFRIKTVQGASDVAALQEVLRRRLEHRDWRRPSLLLIDGGLPQVHAVQAVLDELGLIIPVVGMAKGPERKRNDLIFISSDDVLVEACQHHHVVLEQVRDEAHRFAVSYHRQLRAKNFLV